MMMEACFKKKRMWKSFNERRKRNEVEEDDETIKRADLDKKNYDKKLVVTNLY